MHCQYVTLVHLYCSYHKTAVCRLNFIAVELGILSSGGNSAHRRVLHLGIGWTRILDLKGL